MVAPVEIKHRKDALFTKSGRFSDADDFEAFLGQNHPGHSRPHGAKTPDLLLRFPFSFCLLYIALLVFYHSFVNIPRIFIDFLKALIELFAHATMKRLRLSRFFSIGCLLLIFLGILFTFFRFSVCLFVSKAPPN